MPRHQPPRSYDAFEDGMATINIEKLYNCVLSYPEYRSSVLGSLLWSQFSPEWFQGEGGHRPLLLVKDSKATTSNVSPALSSLRCKTKDNNKDIGENGMGSDENPQGGCTVEEFDLPELTPEKLDAALSASEGGNRELKIFDVGIQKYSHRWSLHEWSEYWNRKIARILEDEENAPETATTGKLDGDDRGTGANGRSKVDDTGGINDVDIRQNDHQSSFQPEDENRLFAIPYLDSKDLPKQISDKIHVPEAVQSVDLCIQFQNSVEKMKECCYSNFFVSMLPYGSFLNSCLAPAGAAQWLYCINGEINFVLCPPTAQNLSRYAAWSIKKRRMGEFFPDECDGVVKAVMKPGQMLMIPAGWCITTSVPSSSILLGGYFLRLDSLTIHLEVLRLEQHLEKSHDIRRQREPFDSIYFVDVLWHCAEKYSAVLSKCTIHVEDQFEAKLDARIKEMKEEEEDMIFSKLENRKSLNSLKHRQVNRKFAANASKQELTPRKRPSLTFRERFVDLHIDSQDEEDHADSGSYYSNDFRITEAKGRKCRKSNFHFPERNRKLAVDHVDQGLEKLMQEGATDLKNKSSNVVNQYYMTENLNTRRICESSDTMKVKLRLEASSMRDLKGEKSISLLETSRAMGMEDTLQSANGSVIGIPRKSSKLVPYKVDGISDIDMDGWRHKWNSATQIKDPDLTNVCTLVRQLRNWMMTEIEDHMLHEELTENELEKTAFYSIENKRRILATLETGIKSLNLKYDRASKVVLHENARDECFSNGIYLRGQDINTGKFFKDESEGISATNQQVEPPKPRLKIVIPLRSRAVSKRAQTERVCEVEDENSPHSLQTQSLSEAFCAESNICEAPDSKINITNPRDIRTIKNERGNMKARAQKNVSIRDRLRKKLKL